MADLIQCENCGAVLAKEDVFCGECGAPRPREPSAAEPAAGAPQVVPEPPIAVPPSLDASPPPSATPSEGLSSATEARWRVATIVLIGLGILACLAGLVGFLLVGSIGGDTTTQQEDWLISALCCLLPIGGTGAILAAAGAAVWYARLRS
jgi:hypothetical protein